MTPPEPPTNHRLFWIAVGLAGVATAGLPLLILAWWQSRKMHDDFGIEISPAVQWFFDWETPAFFVIGLTCMAAYAILALSARNRAATLLAMALSVGSVSAETVIALLCIVFPVAKLVRDLS
jgi:hypothetical protein